MAMQRRFKVAHKDVFPRGAYLKSGPNGPVEPVTDFNAEPRPDGSRPQQRDKDTGFLLWQVTVIDFDEDAGKKDSAVSVKFAAEVRPVPPENKTEFPATQVEFVGLTALPWIDDSGGRPRIAWSFKADDMVAPQHGSQRAKPDNGPGGPTPKAAA